MTLDAAERRGLPLWILVWFCLDAIVGLAPPLYWLADGQMTPILGIPAALFYFLAVAVFIAASIVAAYLADSDVHGEGAN